ncbi:DUF6440 family protein [Marinilactibacillus kalidii]|uniref:DUF6440 family protein n=1 Tax=Marinilactibacillus kalidii TaxID=2820274 RepID=UPI001ABDC4E6|nr:DUF6440 family protein [Marinilactibacillus kalidii]
MFSKDKYEVSKEKRFVVKSVDQVADGSQYTIVVDRVTGVHYLQTWVGGGSSITPLLDAQGRVVIEHSPNV